MIIFNDATSKFKPAFEPTADGRGRYRCGHCGTTWEAPPLSIGDGRFAIVAFVICSPACMTEVLDLPIPKGRH